MSFSSVSGTNSLISGVRPAVRLPSWVVATAPRPPLSTPNLPVAGFTARAVFLSPTCPLPFTMIAAARSAPVRREGRSGALGLLVDPHRPLHHRDQREEGQDEDDRGEHDPPVAVSTEHRHRADPEHP